MNKFDFKEDLRRALKEKRFSQIELAHKSGISQSVISKFLLEDTDIRLSTFISLCFVCIIRHSLSNLTFGRLQPAPPVKANNPRCRMLELLIYWGLPVLFLILFICAFAVFGRE